MMNDKPDPDAYGDKITKDDLKTLVTGTKLVYCAPSIDGDRVHVSDTFVVDNTPGQLVLNRYVRAEGIRPAKVRWSKATNAPVGDPGSKHFLAFAAEDKV